MLNSGYYSLHALYQIKTGDYGTPYQILNSDMMIKRLEELGYTVEIKTLLPEYSALGCRTIYNVSKPQ